MSPPGDGVPGPARRSVLLNPWLLATLAGMALVTAVRPALIREPEPPPRRDQLPRFLLADQHGRPFGTDDLLGRTWVGALLDPREDAGGEASLAAAGDLHRRVAGADVPVRVVTVSIVPVAPERLRRLGLEHGAEFSRWVLLSGDPAQTCRLAVAAFRSPLDADLPTCEDLPALAARSRFVIVDRQGWTRGLYPAGGSGVDEVFHRARHVAGATAPTR